MSPNDTQIPDVEPTDEDPSSQDVPLSRRTALKSMAAMGASATVLGAAAGSASAQSTPHEIVVERISDRVEYRIEVSGEIVKGPESGTNDQNPEDNVVFGVLEEGVNDDVDDFRFSGKVVDIDVMRGKAEFTIKRRDEKKEKREEKDEKKDDKKDDEKHEVTFRAHDPHVKYEFVVTGDVEPGDEADIGTGDYIDGKVVTGNVAGSGVDSYHYTGEIEKFHVTDADKVTVEIDGEEVDPRDVGDWGHLMIKAHGPHVKYEFKTDGKFEPGSEAEMGVGSFIDDGKAHGNVAGSHGRDNYWFTGELTHGDVSSDDVTVLVDGEEVDPDEIGD